jgi:periplasmic protein TonB
MALIRYNVLVWRARQPAWPMEGVATSRLPGAPRYPLSGGSPRRRAPLAASLLLHFTVAVAVALWLPPRAPTRPEPDQPIEMIFQPPAEAAAEVPQPPSAEAAPAPAEAPPPRPPEPMKQAPPVPVAPPPPQVEEAPPVPSVPAPVEAMPAVPPPVAEQPRERPKPAPPPRQQPRPIVRAPPAAPQPAPSAAPPQTATPTPVEAPPAPISTAWRQALSAWLAAHKSYPEAARRGGEEGSVALRFAVERSGRVTEVSVARGSGSPVLDAAAEAMLRNATLPAFPATMSQERIVVTVQLHFSLTN